MNNDLAPVIGIVIGLTVIILLLVKGLIWN
jgi:hypothetical protein